MKVYVTRACGHEEQVEVFGTSAQRESKIKWYESTDCKACYAASQHTNETEVTMSYSEYKNNYADCKTKSGSYDAKAKTIVVYVPAKTEETVELEITEEQVAEIIATATGCTADEVKATVIKHGSANLRKFAEQAKDKLVASPDRKNKHENAYVAAIAMADIAEQYGI